MKRTDELLKLDICCITQIYAKYFLILVVLGSVLLSMTPVSAITVDGYKSTDEWNESWFYGQETASNYSSDGPFGDRLVIRQGLYEGLYATNLWYDIDPKDDSGVLFSASMASLGESSGYDISRIYAHYDPINDTVYGLIEVYGIPGDLDGDNDVSAVGPGDTEGAAGPAGVGLGDNEYWRLRMIQDGTSTSIKLEDNDWVITGSGLTYDDIEARFTSDQTNSVYEISLSNISQHYTIGPGAVLAMELIAGSSADIPGEDSATVFIQIPLSATIGDYVWSDTDNDGLQNVSESGISGVLVDLVLDDTIISTNTTDVNGLYLFDNLVADCYDIVINSSNFESGGALKGHIASPVNAGTDDTIDSDGIDNSSSVCVNPGDVNLTIDFGYVPLPATIGDYVWSDTDNDGLQNVSESGISGVLIDLVLNGTIISTNTTDANGLYLFGNLVADCYNVTINSSNFESGGALKGHIASPVNAGTDDTIDSDGIDNSSSVCVNPGDVNLTIDFGYVPLPATIGDYVWSDTDNDGLQNVSESGISGVLIDLVLNGTIISTNTTDANGLYLFGNLVADCYNVTINSSNFESGGALKGHIASPADAGTDDTIDSDGIDNSSSVCVDPGDVNLTIDFGYVPLPATIGNYVWEDTDNNSIQNFTEFGIPGVLIDLVLDGTIISNDTTDCSGLYLFENLVADCYDVVINSSNFESGGVLEGRIASIADAGTNDTIDSDGINNASGVCVDPGDVNLTIDFGYYEPCTSDNATIGDYVWADINQNGIQNNDCEPGIPCVVVDLVQDGSIISTTMTDKCGFYMFDIMVGCYSGVECYDVVINSSNFDSGGILFGHTASPHNVGINDEIDSDGINNIASLCVFAGDENPTIDFGYYNPEYFDYIYDSEPCPDCDEDD